MLKFYTEIRIFHLDGDGEMFPKGEICFARMSRVRGREFYRDLLEQFKLGNLSLGWARCMVSKSGLWSICGSIWAWFILFLFFLSFGCKTRMTFEELEEKLSNFLIYCLVKVLNMVYGDLHSNEPLTGYLESRRR